MPYPGNTWLIIGEFAEKYRALSKRARSPRTAAMLRMAANILEQAAWEVMNGRLKFSTMENLEVMENLLKVNRLPVNPIRRARTIIGRTILNRIEEISTGMSDVIGLPV